MNERIKQLAEQAGSTHSSHAQGEEHMNDRINELWAKAVDIAVPETYTSLSWGQIQKIKLVFAQLIVQECMQLNSRELSITAIERLLPMYQEHFEVEE